MFHLFSDIFSYRGNALTGLDARVKLATALSTLVCVAFSTHIALPLFSFCFCCAVMAALRFPVAVIAPRIMFPFGIVAALFLLKVFMTPGESVWTLSAAGLSISATREGFQQGALLGAKVAGGMSAALLLGLVAPAHEIFRALRWMGAPKVWVEIAMLMYRYVFVLLDAASDMATAQKLRLGYSDTRRAVRSAGVLSGAVLLRSIDQAERTNEAMMLRCYNGAIPVGKLPPLKRRDYVLIFLLPAFPAAACLLFEKALFL